MTECPDAELRDLLPDRVGGRLWTDVVDGAMLELGGQWVSPDQDALKDTIEELGLETYSRYREGDSVCVGREASAGPRSGGYGGRSGLCCHPAI